MSLTIYIISNAKNAALRKMTQDAVNSARDTTPDGVGIVVYEQAKTPPYKGAKVRTERNRDKPFNYSAACNWAVRDCKTEFVGIFNNDVVFYGGWWGKMKEHFHWDGELMAASPICHRTFDQLYTNQIIAMIGYKIRVHVCGWALVFRKSLIDIIGEFDEQFPFWFTDDDYAMRMKKAGVKNALIPTARVDHLESKTLNTVANMNALTHSHRDKFKRKWGL